MKEIEEESRKGVVVKVTRRRENNKRVHVGWQLNRWPDPSSISEDAWEAAELTIGEEVLPYIQPTRDSLELRASIIHFLQRLLENSIGVQVFPYGSVPLKTFLPYGDIDLTALTHASTKNSLPRDVFGVLEREQANQNPEFKVTDTLFIDAEVKLVKCLVNGILIDISFNQLGGISSMCFLEQMDRYIGKEHLFKRSIILIKAWCYYESRILGGNNGLMSTYALESLILFIFHWFHSSLNGPLAVLYRFLDYYSKFDWENYCASLNGPVRRSSLPNIVVENQNNEGAKPMLDEGFLRNYMEMFSSSSTAFETDYREFPIKFLNIIDPLKQNNNLGRSVHKASLHRIRAALRYGARQLGCVLLLPKDEIPHNMKNVFEGTFKRHGPRDLVCRSLGLTRRDATFLCRHKGASLNELAISGLDDDISDTLFYDLTASAISSLTDDTKTLNLSDLTGDYDSHIQNMIYGIVMRCYGYASLTPEQSNLASSSSLIRKKSWDNFRPYIPLKLQANPNGEASGQPLYAANNHHTPATTAFDLDAGHTVGGTCIYYTGGSSLWEEPSEGGWMIQAQETNSQLQHATNNIVSEPILPEGNSIEEGDLELEQAHSAVLQCETPKTNDPRHVHVHLDYQEQESNEQASELNLGSEHEFPPLSCRMSGGRPV